MVIRLISLMIFLSVGSVFANDSLHHTNDSLRYKIGIRSEFFINSNVLNTKIISGFYFGKNLSLDLRSTLSDRADKLNRAGFHFTNAVEFGLKSSQTDWTFSVGDKMFADMKFTDDLYDLVFIGNRKFEGKEASLSNSGLRYWRYQSVKATAEFERGKGKWLVGLSVLNGHNYFQVETQEAKLFTDTFGISLDLTADAFMRRPDTASAKAFSRGTGAAVDLGYSFNFPAIKSAVSFKVQDLGFIQFNRKSITETIDTTIHYEGFELTQLFPFSDSISPELSGDSLKQKFTKTDVSKFTAMIPAAVSLELSQKGTTWLFKESLIIRPFTYALPEVRFEAQKNIRNFYYSVVAQAGGYSYAGAGFSVGYNSGSTLVALDAHHIEGLILPGLTSGILIGLRLNRCF